MRLTLRTLLAYMDDILDPKDAEVIAKKIEESEFATKLLYRTREVMRRLRLGAPNVGDRGAGLDPNTVAEYLDNTLDDAQVPDFEKVCLESDMHLAEVASCHQILALVLGEPAEVDPVSRQRMYHLPEVLAARAKKEAAGPMESPASAADDGHSRPEAGAREGPPKATVPDYLRPEKAGRRLWQATAGLVALFLVAVIVLLAAGQFEPGTRLGRLLGLGQRVEQAADPGAGRVSDAPFPPERLDQPASEPAALEPAPLSATESKPEMKPAETDQPAGPDVAPPSVAPGAQPAPSAPSVASTPGAAAPEGDRLSAPPGTEFANPLREPPPPAALGPPSEAALPGPAAVDRLAKPASPAPGLANTASDEPPAPAPEQPEGPFAGPAARPARPLAEPGPAAQTVGRLLPAGGILLRLDAGSNTWDRVAADGVLASQDRLLSLPVYRPVVLLAGQIRLELIDGTRLDLQPVDAEGVPGVSADYGRLRIMPEWKEKSRIRLQVGSRIGVMTFADAQTEVAIEVSRARRPGVDPETQPPPRSADVYVRSGKISWREMSDQELAFNAPVRFTLNDRPLEAVAVQQLPKWLDSETASPLDQSAATVMESGMKGRAIGLELHEAAYHRRPEVRRLAVRCLGSLGDYELMVTALNDPEQRLNWPDYVEQLREGVSRSPETAAAIRLALRESYRAEGETLYELLWRYPDDRLSAQDAAALIAYLDHGTLAVRVVAFWGNLKPATGLGLLYRPEEPDSKRKPSVARWKDRLKSGWPPPGAVREKEPRAGADDVAPDPPALFRPAGEEADESG